MDIENLKRAAEINAKINKFQSAAENLQSNNARIWVSKDGRTDAISNVCIYEGFILGELASLIDKHIQALLEEAKTL